MSARVIKPRHGMEHAKPYTHEGVTYESFTAFCRAHGVHPSVMYYRLKRGVTGAELLSRRKRNPNARRPG